MSAPAAVAPEEAKAEAKEGAAAGKEAQAPQRVADHGYNDSDYEVSDSESDEDERKPPPPIRIDREADIATLRSSLLTKKEKEERVPLTLGVKEKFASFQKKFAEITDPTKKDEEAASRTSEESPIVGLGAEKLSEAKNRFEKILDGTLAPTEKKIDVKRSEEDKKRIQEIFVDQGAEKEEPKDCSVCNKLVYPVEKIVVGKRIFHKACFRCCKCQKSLSIQTYNAHEGNFYCKIHMAEFVPGAKTIHLNEDAAALNEPDEEEEYAKVSKPKVLDPSIVRSALKSTDDLGHVPSLRSTKSQWETSAQDAQKTEKKTEEELKFDVGAVKKKWVEGGVEGAQTETENRCGELEEIKKNISIKERFKERTGPAEGEEGAQRKSVLEQELLDTSFTHAAKERFKTGEAFQDTAPKESATKEAIQFEKLESFKEKFEKGKSEEPKPEKAPISVRCAEIGSIKAAFDKGAAAGETEEEALAAKKKQLEAEFNRYKREKQFLQDQERREQEEEKRSQRLSSMLEEDKEDLRQAAPIGSIKQRFQDGSAFRSEEQPGKKDEQLEIKVAGKAREKFKQIEKEAPKEAVKETQKGEKKWNTDETKPVPEAINKRVVTADDEDNGPEDFEVKNLLSKFKTFEQKQGEVQKGPKPKRQITPPPGDYRAELVSEGKERDPNVVVSGEAREAAAVITADAKNLKAKFERIQEAIAAEPSEEKKKHLEEEFRKYKEEKQQLKQMYAEEEEKPGAEEEKGSEDLAIAAEHAQKMKAKWEKIEKKEAKKASKSIPKKAPMANTE